MHFLPNDVKLGQSKDQICVALQFAGKRGSFMHKLILVASSARLTHTRQPCSWYQGLSRGMIPTIAFAIILIIGSPSLSQTPTPRPCDIYESAGTPCVAAHSTTRALYAGYNGPLYQVKRNSDESLQDIGVLTTGGYANAAQQDSFCANMPCKITTIYDQSPRHNDLTVEGAGGNGAADVPAPADALPVTAGGHQVYGVSISAGMGYRNNSTSGVAVNGQPEGMYMVTSGTHVKISAVSSTAMPR